MSRTRPRIVLPVAAMLALAGCAAGASPDGRVPDDTIIRTIAGLDGVDASDVRFDDSFGNGSRYLGDVEVARDADAGCVLVQTLGLLKQGRPGVALSSVAVRQGDLVLTLNDLTTEQARELNATTAPADGTPRVPVC